MSRIQTAALKSSWAVLVTALLLVGGCTGGSKRATSFEVRTARLEDQVAALESTQLLLETKVDSLRALVAEQVEVVRDRRADHQARVDALQQQLQSLQAELEAARRDISDLKDQVTYSLENRAPVASPDSAGSDTGSTPRSLYETALQDLNRGNHALAIMGFEDVLARFPRSELADNAQYWIGEAYYKQRDYSRALEEFRKLPVSYPAADKVPAAMLKIGYCLQNLNDKEGARSALQELIDRFPNSEEARLADQKLGEL